jgi:hypothetical protein
VQPFFHGGLLDSAQTRVWVSSDRDYAASFASLCDQDFVWVLTLDLDEFPEGTAGCGMPARIVENAITPSVFSSRCHASRHLAAGIDSKPAEHTTASKVEPCRSRRSVTSASSQSAFFTLVAAA